jgi:hypothetical protein
MLVAMEGRSLQEANGEMLFEDRKPAEVVLHSYGDKCPSFIVPHFLFTYHIARSLGIQFNNHHRQSRGKK